MRILKKYVSTTQSKNFSYLGQRLVAYNLGTKQLQNSTTYKIKPNQPYRLSASLDEKAKKFRGNDYDHGNDS